MQGSIAVLRRAAVIACLVHGQSSPAAKWKVSGSVCLGIQALQCMHSRLVNMGKMEGVHVGV